MTPEMFERLIKILSEPDIKGYIIQIFTAALPICYAMWISKKDNKVLDDRQKKLEDNQKLIAKNISKLTEQQAKLSETQEKVEENLRELTELAQQSRKSNQLMMQVHYKEFFEAYKNFKKSLIKIDEFYELYQQFSPNFDDMTHEEYDRFENLNKSIDFFDINQFDFLKDETIPPNLFEDILKLQDSVRKINSRRYDCNYYDEYFDYIYPRLKKIDGELSKLLS